MPRRARRRRSARETVVIEGGEEIGGLCILRGCMPSKTLLESAHRWHEIGRAREFGLVAKPVKVNMKCIQARKQHLIGGFAAYRRKQLRAAENLHSCAACASFLDAQTLLVDARPQAGTGHGLDFHHRHRLGHHARAGSRPVGNRLPDQRHGAGDGEDSEAAGRARRRRHRGGTGAIFRAGRLEDDDPAAQQAGSSAITIPT